MGKKQGEVFRIACYVDEEKLKRKIESLIDDKTMLEIHDLFAKIIDPWTPFAEGVMAHRSLEITPNYICYHQPYAHYMYMGELYLAANGSSWAKENEKKYPSGRPLHYSKEKHQLATAQWDKVAMQTKRDEFELQVRDILMRRAKQLYG